MFSEDRISVIFGNMEAIYEFSQKFLENIESSFVKENPHQSQLGHCFLECVSNLNIVRKWWGGIIITSEFVHKIFINFCSTTSAV